MIMRKIFHRKRYFPVKKFADFIAVYSTINFKNNVETSAKHRKKPDFDKLIKIRFTLFCHKFFTDFLLRINAGCFSNPIVSAEKASFLFAKIAGRSAVIGAAIVLPAIPTVDAMKLLHLLYLIIPLESFKNSRKFMLCNEN